MSDERENADMWRSIVTMKEIQAEIAAQVKYIAAAIDDLKRERSHDVASARERDRKDGEQDHKIFEIAADQSALADKLRGVEERVGRAHERLDVFERDRRDLVRWILITAITAALGTEGLGRLFG